jgi:hypothetical protein
MPTGITHPYITIMTYFYTAAELSDRIEGYFLSVTGGPEQEKKPQLKSRKKESAPVIRVAKGNTPEVPLLTGLALFLGFPSLSDFEAYEQNGIHKKILREARLRIEYEYEKRLHLPSPTGAIFALRCMGWSEKATAGPNKAGAAKLQIKVITSGPKIATTEKEVDV